MTKMKASEQTFYYKHNRLQQLRGFCFAAQYGNISRAAEFMGLNHSSVSLQIKALEDDMGTALFNRNGPKISLTEDGERLLDMALPLVDGIQNLHSEFHRETKARASRELRIAVNNTGKNYLLPLIVRDYVKQHQDVRVIMHLAEHNEAMELIRNNLVDLAILPRRERLPFPKYTEYTPIFHFTPCLITLPDHPLAGRKNLQVAEIKRYPLTLPAQEMEVIAGLNDLFGEQSSNGNIQVEFVNAETGREYIETGLVISVSSNVWIREKDTLVATPLSHLFPDVDYGVIQKTGKPTPKKVREFIDVARLHATGKKKLAGKR